MGTSVMNKENYSGRSWKQKELFFIVTYVLVFYVIIIRRSLQLSHGIFLIYDFPPVTCFCNYVFCWVFSYGIFSLIGEQCIVYFVFTIADHYTKLFGLRPGWLIPHHLNVWLCSFYRYDYLYVSISVVGLASLAFYCWLNVCPVLLCVKDVSDAQWRNFRGNLPVLTLVFGVFTLLANLMRAFFNLKVRGMSIIWLLFSFVYLSYLHGAWYGIHSSFWCRFF